VVSNIREWTTRTAYSGGPFPGGFVSTGQGPSSASGPTSCRLEGSAPRGGALSRTMPAVTFPGSRKWSGASVPIEAVALSLPTRDGPATRAVERQTLLV